MFKVPAVLTLMIANLALAVVYGVTQPTESEQSVTETVPTTVATPVVVMSAPTTLPHNYNHSRRGIRWGRIRPAMPQVGALLQGVRSACQEVLLHRMARVSLPYQGSQRPVGREWQHCLDTEQGWVVRLRPAPNQLDVEDCHQEHLWWWDRAPVDPGLQSSGCQVPLRQRWAWALESHLRLLT